MIDLGLNIIEQKHLRRVLLAPMNCKDIDKPNRETDNSVQSPNNRADQEHFVPRPYQPMEHLQVTFKSIIIAISLSLLSLSAAQAAQLPIAEISSNSVLKDKDKGIVYGPSNMLDQQSATMWVEGDGNAGLGKYISVKFGSEVSLSQFRIWAGCFLDADFWKRHNRVKALELKFPDFTSERVELKDVMEPQLITLKETKQVSSVKIYLRDFYKGSTWNDTAITALEFFDAKGPESYIEGTDASASSHYPDEDNLYVASKAVDGWLDTHWVNGPGSGADDHIEVELGSPRSLSAFGISMGNGATESFFKGSNRASGIELRFSDGSTQSFKLVDKPEMQRFELKPVRSSSVRVSFSGIIKGASNDDLYVGELRFWE